MKVLFITFDKCPNADAGAVRTHMIARMFADSGHDVLVISMGSYTGNEVVIEDNIEYLSFRPKKDNTLKKMCAYYFFSNRLKRYLNRNRFDIVVHTQVDRRTLTVIKHYINKYNAHVLYDAVEWFSPEQFKNGVSSRTYKLNNDYNTILIDKTYKVISISTYLYNNFKHRNIETILIPAVIDTDKISSQKQKRTGKKKIIYAGSPGKKDYLNVIIEAFLLLSEDEKSKIELKIIGCSKQQFFDNFEMTREEMDKVKDTVFFMGRIPREQVINEYLKSDFSILMRSSKLRYAQAGFPTKLAESFATATPIICNLTSDIDMYISHMKNGIIVESEDSEACANALKIVANLTDNQIIEMQKSARHTAEEYFEYKKYSDSLINFVER